MSALPGHAESTGSIGNFDVTDHVGKTEHSTAFPRSARLTRPDQFSQVFADRRVLKSYHFMLHYRLRPEDAAAPGGDESTAKRARLGLVIGKRQLKLAVARNRVKRIARERFRHLRVFLPAVDIILRLQVRLKPEILCGGDLATEISGLLEKLPAAVQRDIARAAKASKS